MNDGSLALICLIIGLTLAIPASCWFGIAIGEERAKDKQAAQPQPGPELCREIGPDGLLCGRHADHPADFHADPFRGGRSQVAAIWPVAQRV